MRAMGAADEHRRAMVDEAAGVFRATGRKCSEAVAARGCDMNFPLQG
jgi:hypothetical protein